MMKRKLRALSVFCFFAVLIPAAFPQQAGQLDKTVFTTRTAFLAGTRENILVSEDGSLVLPLFNPSHALDWVGTNHGTLAFGTGNEFSFDFLERNHLTLIGAPIWTTGKFGKALTFDAINDFAFVPTSHESNFDFERTSPFSLEAWVKLSPKTTADPNHFIIAKQERADNARGFSLIAYALLGGAPVLSFVHSPQQLDAVIGSTNLVDGQFHHVVATSDGAGISGMKLYVDGQSEATTVFLNTLGANTILTDLPLTIGSREKGDVPAKGIIDEVAVYDRVLTQTEVEQHHAQGLANLPTPAGTISYWKFDDQTTPSEGPRWATGKFGGALLFDGLNDHVVQSSGFTDTVDTFTMELWAYPLSSRAVTPEANTGITGTSNQRYAILGDSYTFPDAGAGVSVGTNGVSVFEEGGAHLPSTLVYNAPMTGWNHIVIVYKNNMPTLYLNGQFIKNGLPSTRKVHPSKQFIGGSNYGWYHGYLDEIAVYNRALSEAEIQDHHVHGISAVQPSSGLVSFWRLDDESAPTVGTFTSAVFPGTQSTWKTVRWTQNLPAGTSLSIQTRSGNSPDTSDGTWSSWSDHYPNPSESAIASDPSRYLQWRANLSTQDAQQTPILSDVSIEYQLEEAGPSVTPWTRISGSWDVEDGELSVSAGGQQEGKVWAGDKTWKDYSVVFKARDMDASGREHWRNGIRVRYTDENNHVLIHGAGDPDQFFIYKIINGIPNLLFLGGTSGKEKIWYTYKIEVQGTSFKFYVSGGDYAAETLLANLTISDTSLQSGAISFITTADHLSSHSHFDDVRVTDLDGNVLFRDDFTFYAPSPDVLQQSVQTTEADFLAGMSENIDVSPDGRLSLITQTNPTTAADSIATNHGTLSGPTWTTGKFGGALSLDGVNDFVPVANESNFDFDRTDPFSIEVWVNLTPKTGPGDLNHFLVAKQEKSGNVRGYALLAHTGFGGAPVFAFAASGSQFNIIIGSANLIDGQFHHVVATTDGTGISGMKLYVDGQPETTTVFSNTLGTNSILNDVPLTLGSRQEGNVPAKGILDEIAIYNRALNASEILNHFTQGLPHLPTPAGLVSYWKLDDQKLFNSGDFTSSIFPGELSEWKTISWTQSVPAGTSLSIQTRSGNTENPGDGSWSAWSQSYVDPAGSTITSPSANYIQWRAVFSTEGGTVPVLSDVTIDYVLTATNRLTHDSHTSLRPGFSKDGKRIFFTSYQQPPGQPGSTPIGIFYQTVEGTGEPVLVQANASGGSLSPDGSKLVFKNHQDGNIYVKNADGTGEATLLIVTPLSITEGGVHPFTGEDPRWSPNGRWIIVSGLTVYDLQTHRERQLSGDPWTNSVDVSPDSRYVVYKRWNTVSWEPYTGIWLRVIDGNGDGEPDNQGASFLIENESQGQVENPAFSLDGKKIIYATKRQDKDGTTDFDIWVKDIDSNEDGVPDANGVRSQVLKINNADDIQPAWSPLGTQFVVSSNRPDTQGNTDYDIYVYDILPDNLPERTFPVASISRPQPNENIGGQVGITGTAAGTEFSTFSSYTLEFGKGTDPVSWAKIKTSSQPVHSGLLGTWDTRTLTPGIYTLRLLVVDQEGDLNEVKVLVEVITGDIVQLTHNTLQDAPFSFSPDGSKVGYVSGNFFVRSGSGAFVNLPHPIFGDIYMQNVDGTGVPELLKKTALFMGFPPLGSEVILAEYDSEEDFSSIGKDPRLVIRTLDGTLVSELNLKGQHPLWSPNGRWIGYVSGALHVFDLSTSKSYPLQGEENQFPPYCCVGQFSWSPDSRYVLYEKYEWADPDVQIPLGVFLQEVDGNLDGLPDKTGRVYLVEPPGGTRTSPQFLPDGKRFAFYSRRADATGTTDFDIWVKEIDGNGDGVPDNQGARNQVVSGYPVFDYLAVWQPGGGVKLVFSSDRLDAEGTTDMELYAMDFLPPGSAAVRTGPFVLISDPKENDEVYDKVSVKGTVKSTLLASLSSYTLSFGKGHVPTSYIAISSGSSAVEDSVLGEWNLAGLEAGEYTLKLSATDTEGDTTTHMVHVLVMEGKFLQLTHNTVSEFQATFSPDSTKIAYVSGTGTSTGNCSADWNIYLRTADGAGEPVLFEDCATHPSFSPDGTKIVFRDDTNGRITVKNLDGTGRTNLNVCCLNPAWSPNGRYIAYTEHDSLRLFDLQTSSVYEVGEPSVNYISWSFDSRYVAYDKTGVGIFVQEVDGNGDEFPDNEGKVYHIVKNTGAVEPAFAPDGIHLLFTTHREDPAGTVDTDIWIQVIDSDGDGIPDEGGGASPLVTTYPSKDFSAAVSLDGKKIAFSSDRKDAEETFDSEIYVKDVVFLTKIAVVPEDTPPVYQTSKSANFTGTASDTGTVLLEQTEPVSAPMPLTLQSSLANFTSVGKFLLVGDLTSSLGQRLSQDVKTFFVTDRDLVVNFFTDKPAYKPGETITITGSVKNTGGEAQSNLALTLKQDAQELFAETFSLNPGEEHPFQVTTSAQKTFVLEVLLSGESLKETISVEPPIVEVSLLAPDLVGQGSFAVKAAFENKGKTEAAFDAALAKESESPVPQSFTLSPGQRETLELTQAVLQNTTYLLTTTGDISGSFTKVVAFGEGATVFLTPEAVYSEGPVRIPFVVTSTGVLDTQFTLTLVINSETFQKEVVLPAGGVLSDGINVSLPAGSHALVATTPFEEVSKTILVQVPNQVEIASLTSEGISEGKVALKGVLKNVGPNAFSGNLSLETDFNTESQVLSLAIGEEKTITFQLPPPSLAGTYEGTLNVSHSGTVVDTEMVSFNVPAPTFAFVGLPQSYSFTAGQTATFSVSVKNTGITQGEAEISLRTLDLLSETQTLFFIPGETRTLTFTADIPPDYPSGDYKAVLGINGEENTDVALQIQGAKVNVAAALDKDLYNVGETAKVTLDVTNQSELPSMALFARVKFNGFDETKNFILNGEQMVQFNVPVTLGEQPKLFFGVYQQDGGRSLVLNSLYVPISQAIQVFTNKQVYQIGETAKAFVKTSEPGSFAAQVFSETVNLDIDASLQTVFTFAVPPVAAGTYQLGYAFGDQNGVINFDVAGYQLKVYEMLLDKPAYNPQDQMVATWRVHASHPLSVLFSVALLDPNGSFTTLLAKTISLQQGENRLDENFTLNTSFTGLHRLVYFFNLTDPSLFLTAGSEAFDVAGASLLFAETTKAEYDTRENVQLKATVFGNIQAQFRVSVDGQLVHTETLLISGLQEFTRNLGKFAVGAHTVSAQLTSTALSEQETSFTVVQLDTQPPTITITFPATPTDETPGEFTWTVTDETALGTVTVLLDGTSYSTEASGSTPVPNSLGEHCLEVTASDAAGNSANDKKCVTVADDDITAPVLSDLSITPVLAKDGDSVEVSAKATDPESGVTEVFVDATSIGGNTKEILTLSNGTYTKLITVNTGGFNGFKEIKIQATNADNDRAGDAETSDPVSLTIKIDNTAPTTTLTPSAPLINSEFAPLSTTYTLTAVDPVVGGVSSGVAKIQYAVGSGPFADYTTAIALTEGIHTIIYQSTDNVGNVEQTKTFTVKVDATAPITTLTPSAPLFNNEFAPLSTTYTLSANDPVSNGVSSGVSKTEFRIDTGNWQLAAGSFTLSEGVHTIEYRSVDNVGNTESLRTFTVKVDATAPITELSSVSGQMSVNDKIYISTTMALTFNATDPISNGVASGVARTEFRIDTGNWQLATGSFTLPEGIHTVTFRSIDNVGNTESEKSRTYHVDGTAPTTTASVGNPQCTLNGKLTVGAKTPITLSASDPEVLSVSSGVKRTEYRLNGGSFVAYSSPFTISGVPDGQVTIEFRSVDNVGNTDQLKTLIIVLDTTPPTAQILSPFDLTVVNGSVAITGTCSGFDTGSWTLESCQLPASSCQLIKTSTDVITESTLATWDTTSLQNGSYTLRLTATDCIGNQAKTEISLVVGSPVVSLALSDSFNKPEGVYVRCQMSDAKCQLYVADRDNDKVKIYELTSNIWQLTSELTGFNKPADVFVDAQNNVYVVDRNNDAVKIFKLTSNIWQLTSELTGFNKPEAVFADSQGTVYVADRNNNRIAIFSLTSGIWQLTSELTGFDHPEGVAYKKFEVGSGKLEGEWLYVSDTGQNKVKIFKLTSNIWQLTSELSGFNNPGGLYVTNKGYLYIVSQNDAKIYKYDSYLNLLMTFGSQGNNDGQFNKPKDIAVKECLDSSCAEELYIADRNHNQVQKFIYSTVGGKLKALEKHLTPPLAIGDVYTYPNPFSPNGDGNLDTTQIHYVLSQPADVTIRIYNVVGKLVKTFDTRFAGSAGGIAGENEVTWDGKNDLGRIVANGVYIVHIEAKAGDERVETMKKFSVLK